MSSIVETKYIDYTGYKPNEAQKFFEERQNNIRLMKTNEKFTSNKAKWQQILSNAQKGFQLVNEHVTEQELRDAIEKSMGNTELGQSVENMAQTMNQLFKSKDAIAADVKQKYMNGYQEFEALWNAVKQSGRLVVKTADLQQIVNQLDGNAIVQGVGDIANTLGKLGELAGLIQLSQIADELLATSFKNINRDDIKVELYNIGQQRTLTNQTLTTDNLLVIKRGNEVLFQLNLSNKLNTKFSASNMQKSTEHAIKLRTTTVSAFLTQNPNYARPVFNVYSYHWNTSTHQREDWVPSDVGVVARQTIGLQILYDHIYGTRGTFQLDDGQMFKDEVGLIAYGNKIIYSDQVLRDALFTKSMQEKKAKNLIQARIDRKDWFNTENIATGPTNIINELDAQRRIAKFNIMYMQTLQL